MSIQTEKLTLIEWISQLSDTAIIERLRVIKEEADHQREEAESESVKRGLRDFEEGRVYPHDAAQKIYGKYL